VSGEADAAGVLRTRFSHACPGTFSLEPVAAAEVNSRNWIVRLGGEPRFVLKRGPFQRIVEFYGELSRRTPLLPPLVAYAVERNELFRLLEFRDGHAFPGGDAALAGAARALAQLHLALREAPGSLPYSERYLPLRQEEISGPLAGELPRWYREVEALEALPDLPRGWIHHDYHPANVLFRGDRVVAILDMDSLGTDFRMQAGAFAASRFGNARGFLAAYDAVDPLTETEKRNYTGFVRREAVRRINWILREGGDAWRRDLDRHVAALQ